MTPNAPADPSDDVVAALDHMAGVLDDNADDQHLLARRIRHLGQARRTTRSWTHILDHEAQPGTLELTNRILGRLNDASGRLRRALAQALRQEGTTVSAIANRFGVTHQRISRLVNHTQ